MEKLEKLNSGELKKVLKWLKLYRDLSRKLWNRWKAIFNRELSWKDLYKVEHTSTMSKNIAWERAIIAFEKAFWKKLKKEDVIFVENDSIFWGIKIFRNDDMIDLSLSKAIDQIK